jgi:hypothetical protein
MRLVSGAADTAESDTPAERNVMNVSTSGPGAAGVENAGIGVDRAAAR